MFGGIRNYLALLMAPPHLRKACAAEGSISIPEADLLYSLARAADGGCIIEIGSWRGRSTIALALGASAGNDVKVYAFDPHETFVGVLGRHFGPEDRGTFYRNMLRSGCYKNVRLINLSSELILWNDKVSLLWIDGDHTYDGVRRDFECWEQHLTKSAIIAFDDATDENLGPLRLIRELRDYEIIREVGKIVVIKRIPSARC